MKTVSEKSTDFMLVICLPVRAPRCALKLEATGLDDRPKC
jgi:hypothetical protein